jgi:pyrimidine deaminase RibD-like protein
MNENKKAFIAIDNNNIQSHKGMHEKYMSRAIELAKMGRGFTDPNPVVGAVIVKDGEIIGEGYHER